MSKYHSCYSLLSEVSLESLSGSIRNVQLKGSGDAMKISNGYNYKKGFQTPVSVNIPLYRL